jgi:hypothetical protein
MHYHIGPKSLNGLQAGISLAYIGTGVMRSGGQQRRQEWLATASANLVSQMQLPGQMSSYQTLDAGNENTHYFLI